MLKVIYVTIIAEAKLSTLQQQMSTAFNSFATDVKETLSSFSGKVN